MKQLYLMRHAKSSWKHRELADIDRPLNKRGLRDAPMMGERLAKMGFKTDLIVSSPATRAVVTARAIAEKIGYPASDIRRDEDVYLAETQTLLDLINGLDDRYERVMLFGHNPGFTVLANRIGDTEIENMPTAAIAIFDLNIDSWADAAPRCGRLRLFDFPKNVK